MDEPSGGESMGFNEWVGKLHSSHVTLRDFLEVEVAPPEVWEAFEFLWARGALYAIELS